MYWNAQQRDFITRPLGDGRLLGIPGGGKTRALLGRVLHLIDSGKIPPKNGFVVLAFSKLACADFLQKGAKMRAGVFDKGNVRTVHSLSGSIVHALLGRTAPSSKETVVFRATREVQNIDPDGLRNAVHLLRSASALFVDEAQDLSRVQYDFACALRDKLGAPLVLVGDPNQNIYQFQGGSDEFLRNHPGFEVALSVNYRSTASIVRTVEAFRPYRDSPPMVSGVEAEGPKPVIFCEEQHTIVRDVVHRAKQAMRTGKTVAVIGPVRKSKPLGNGTFLNLGLQLVVNTLHAENIPHKIHYSEDSSSEGDVDNPAVPVQTRDKGVVHLLTCHGSKGLEFDVVLVLNFHLKSMGIVPKTERDAAALDCLWFVALSRAKQEMAVYCHRGEPVWPRYTKIMGMMRAEAGVPKVSKQRCREEKDDWNVSHSWVRDVLKNKERMTEERLAQLEDVYAVSLGEQARIHADVESWADAEDALPEEQQLCMLYGIWAENTFYHHYRGGPPPVLREIQGMLRNGIDIPSKHLKDMKMLWRTLGQNNYTSIRWKDLEENRRVLSKTKLRELMALVFAYRPRDVGGFDEVYLRCPNSVQWWDSDQLHGMLAAWESEARLSLESMWRMCLFRWQYVNECGYRWNTDCSEITRALTPYHDRIVACAMREPDGLSVQQTASMTHLPIKGVVDVVHEGAKRLVEIKFCRELDHAHALQAVGYAEMVGGRDPQDWTVELYNLRRGVKRRVFNNLGDRAARWRAQLVLGQAVDWQLERTVWLYDLETTGLDVQTCGLLEIHLEEYWSGLVPLSTLVRQPHVPEEVTSLTGIRAADTEGAPADAAVCEAFRRAMQSCASPRLLAHNGNRFDHKIMGLRNALPEGVRLVDTVHLLAVASMGPKARGERKSLTRVYESVMRRPYGGTAHRAAADVQMMRELLDAARIPHEAIQ